MDRASLSSSGWAATALTLSLLTLVVSSGARAFSVPVADNDLWGHIYFGQEILRAGLPEHNLYSYTAPGHRWINHEILAECAFAWVYGAFGPAGLVGLKTLSGLLTLAILFFTARMRTPEPVAWATAIVIAALLMSEGYLVRPQIFTFLALAFLWSQLQRRASGRRAELWTIPPLFALWVNTHGGVAAGLAVFGAFAVLQPSTPKERKLLAAIFFASCVALLANPYGLELVTFLVRDVLRHRNITEWEPIPLLGLSHPLFKVAALAFLISTFLRSARPVWEHAIIGAALVAAARHERHLPLFAILFAPYLAGLLGRTIEAMRLRHLHLRTPRTTLAIAVGVLLAAGVQTAATLRIHRPLRFGIFVAPDLFPVQAVRFLRENRVRGNLAVPFDWGEYAIWHLYPDCRVSIDGRYSTAYPEDVLAASERYAHGSHGWADILAEATLALTDRRRETTVQLEKTPGWRKIYSDETAVVFAREGARLPESLSPPTPTLVREAILFP